MTAMLFVLPKQRLEDANGSPAPGSKLYFYTAGTTSQLTVYQDRARTVAHAQPVVADADGYFAPIYPPDGTYKVVVKDQNDALLWTADDQAGPVDLSGFGTGAGAWETPVITKNATYSVQTSDIGSLINCDPSGGNFTVTGLSAVVMGNKKRIGMRHNGASGQVMFASVLGQNILLPGGTSTTSVALTGKGETYWFVSDGAQIVVDVHVPPLIGSTVSVIQIAARQSAPPASPTPGARYIINATPTLAWFGRTIGDIAESDGNGGWFFYAPPTNCGWLAYVQGESLNTQWQGSAWVDLSNITAPAASSMRRLLVVDQRTSGTNGGTSTGGAWNARTLNTVVTNTLLASNGAASDASLSGNAITVPPCLNSIPYRVTGFASIFNGAASKTRLRSQTAVTSTTSLAIGTGSKALTIAASQSFAVNGRIMARSAGTAGQEMHGTVTAYSGTTLTVNVDSTLGSGTYADWNIYNEIVSATDTATFGSGGCTVTNRFDTQCIIAAADTFILESYISSGTVTSGLGVAVSNGSPELYAAIEFFDPTSLQGPKGQQGLQGSTGAGYQATSTTSLTIGTGSQTVTTQTGLAYLAGMRARIAKDSSNYMEGPVASYSGSTLVITADRVIGSGTYTAWNIGLAGDVGPTGATGSSGSAGATGATGATGPNVGLDYTWSTGTSGDPGSGKLLVNNVTPASATQINISETNRLGAGQSPYIATWDDSTTASNKGIIRIVDVANPGTNFLEYRITAALTDAGAYDTFPVTYIGGAGTIANGTTVSVAYFPTGDKGADGAGTGDFSSNTATSVDGEMVLFSGTTGKTGKRSVLTGGLLKSTSGVPAIAAAGTDYLAPPSGTALLKANSGGALANATAGIDYLAPPSGTALLKANSGGALANATAGTDYCAATSGSSVLKGLSGNTTAATAGTDYVAPGTSTTFTKAQGFGIATLTDAATIAWDVSSNQSAQVTLGASRTMGAVTNAVAGFVYTLVVLQDATGSRLVTWTTSGAGSFDFGTDGAPTLTTTASKGDILSFLAVSIGGTLKLRYCGIKKGFA